MSNQERMPFVEALEVYKEQDFVPFIHQVIKLVLKRLND